MIKCSLFIEFLKFEVSELRQIIAVWHGFQNIYYQYHVKLTNYVEIWLANIAGNSSAQDAGKCCYFIVASNKWRNHFPVKLL